VAPRAGFRIFDCALANPIALCLSNRAFDLVYRNCYIISNYQLEEFAKLKLGRFSKIFLVIFDMVLLTFIVDNFVRQLVPVDHPVYWVAAAIEVGLGFFTYWFWMRSLLVKGFKFDRIMAIVLVVVGCALPNLFYISGYGILNPAGSTDLYYYVTVVSLVIYSSYIFDRNINAPKKRGLKPRSKKSG
jgi:hypothetical protein